MQFPKPLGEVAGYWLRPDGATVPTAIVPLPAGNAEERERYTKKGFRLVSHVRGENRRMVAEPPTPQEIQEIVAEIESRQEAELGRLSDELGEAREESKDGDVARDIRSLQKRRIKAINKAQEAIAEPIDGKALYEFFIEQRRLQILAQVPAEYRQAMALQAEEAALSEKLSEWETVLA